MKNKFLAVYDYGMGAIWRYIWAESPDEIRKKYPELEILEKEPSWFSEDYKKTIRICDLDDSTDPFLQKMRDRIYGVRLD
ncbi:MAG: hypothetical protein RPU34_06600 [Candidatus Sedimenticola sp. (ex Thyasira tokunagai)]